MDWIVDLPERLDTFLATREGMLSRARAQKEIEAGRVFVNDAVATKTAERLQEGDKVSWDGPSEIVLSAFVPANLSLTVLYEDDACMVINKPAGIAVHPGAGMPPDEKTILHGIAFLFQKQTLPFSPEAVLVHRLDRETTGCLLIAKTPAAHLFLQKQFETRTVSKMYLALVAGVPSLPTAKIDAPIGRSPTDRTKMSVFRLSAAREAQTTYRVLASAEHASLLECDLHTGRTHQVRVHLHSIGHPVLGDGTYRTVESERVAGEYAVHDLCLHAWKLTFRSPIDEKDHAVTAPLPSSLIEAMRRVGIQFSLR